MRLPNHAARRSEAEPHWYGSSHSGPDLGLSMAREAVLQGAAVCRLCVNARLLWAVRDDPLARGLFLDSLAASTALASRMLLVAV
jgi:hypothetical protein